MKLINLFAIFLLLAGISTAQLEADRDRFEIDLHPDEMTTRTFKLENMGDTPIFEITPTPVSGSVEGLVSVDVLEFERLVPEIDDVYDDEEVEVEVHFSIPPDTEPGVYTGYVYLLSDSYPSLPPIIDFEISVTEQENYGVSLNIEDTRSAVARADVDKPAKFELTVRNAGLFKDVITIDSSPVPEGWKVVLVDGDEPKDLPYRLPTTSGAIRRLDLEITGKDAGMGHEFNITAASLGDPSKNATVKARVDLNMEVRRYVFVKDIPSLMVVNRTYTGSIKIQLGIEETISATAIAPPGLMVIPETQSVKVGETKVGTGEFTLMPTEPGIYILRILLVDSNGIILPEERMKILVVASDNFALATGDDVLCRSIAFSYAEGEQNETLSEVLILPTVERVQEELGHEETTLTKVVILGDESVVSAEVEDELKKFVTVERIAGTTVCETSWLFASAMWPRGAEVIVLTSEEEADVFEAYQAAKALHVPLVICGSDLSSASLSVIEDIMKREIPLRAVLLSGKNVDESVIQPLRSLNLSVEEVAL